MSLFILYASLTKINIKTMNFSLDNCLPKLQPSLCQLEEVKIILMNFKYQKY